MLPLETLAFVALASGLSAAAGAVFGASRSRRTLSGLLVLAVVATPFLVDTDHRLARSLTGLSAMLVLMRWIEASRTRSAPALPWWLLFVLPFDVPSLRSGDRRLARDVLARGAVHAALLCAGVVVIATRGWASGLGWLVAWLGGVLALYGGVDAIASTAQACLAAAGYEAVSMQRHPVLSRSVTELWGERWNRVVGGWIRRHVFLPIGKRAGAAVGLGAGFLWSGVFHAYIVGVALGARPALGMCGYFVIQGALVLLETRLTVSRWPRPLGHAWTVLGVVGPSWLFVEPVLAIFGAW